MGNMTDNSRRENVDWAVVKDFGAEWEAFDFAGLSGPELQKNFEQYFGIFPFDALLEEASGFDMGCGTGRWARFVADRVGHLICVDPSAAIDVAKRNLSGAENVSFLNEDVSSCSIETGSQDFGYSLGVLHHIPDTARGIADCGRLLKSGAPFLLYLYYNFENRPLWFRGIWQLSNVVRRVISALPHPVKKPICDVIAVLVYWPLARGAALIEKLGGGVNSVPLSDYRDKPFYQMRNDALDRFGTKLEQRFSRAEITAMLEAGGFERVSFSDSTPYWVALSYKV